MEFFLNKVAGLTKAGLRHSSSQILQFFLFLYQCPDIGQCSEKSFQKSTENNSDGVLFFSEVADFEVTEKRSSQ